jgi:tRNA nucleotidyltransferase (CCA-adding enzyme)
LHELRDSGDLSYYPEIFNLIDVPQDPTWHPEGDVWVHTCHVLDAAADIAVRENLGDAARELLIFSALTHDFGKVKATFLKNGRWTSPKHGLYSTDGAKKFLTQVGCTSEHLYEKLEKLVIEHLSYVNVETDKSLLNLAERLKPASIEELLWLIEADVSGRPPLPKGLPDQAKKLKARSLELGVYQRGPTKLVSENLLLQHKILEHGPQMEAVIKQAYAAQLAGTFLNEKDALAWVRGQIFKPILNGRLIIDGGILPSGNKVGKLLEAAKLAQRRGIFSDLDGALTWAKHWVEN